MKPPIIAILAADWSFRNELPIMILSHEGIQESATVFDIELINKHQQKIKLVLDTHSLPSIVKTITVSVKYQRRKFFLLLTGVGDWKVNARLKENLSKKIDIPKNRLMHNSRINDPEFDPLVNLGLSAGFVGPFPYFIKNLDHVIFVKPETHPQFVAIRLTPFDMLILTKELFEILMIAYLRWIGDFALVTI